MTHICISKLSVVGLDNGLSPDQRQAIIWTNVGILLIGPLATNFSEILIEIRRLKMASWKWRPFCLGLNVLTRSAQWLGIALVPTAWHETNTPCVTCINYWMQMRSNWKFAKCLLSTTGYYYHYQLWCQLPTDISTCGFISKKPSEAHSGTWCRTYTFCDFCLQDNCGRIDSWALIQYKDVISPV